MLEDYLGHVITAALFLGTGAVAWGVLKTQVGALRKDRDDHEARLRLAEQAKASWEAHVAESPQVLERLRDIEVAVREIQSELAHRSAYGDRLDDAMKANTMVLGELSEKIVRIETLMERNGKEG